MRKRLIAVYLLIILLPMILITWLSWRNMQNEREHNRIRFQAVLAERLKDVDERIQSLLRRREADFIQMAEIYSMPIDEIRRVTRKTRLVKQFFILDSENNAVYPNPDDILSTKEKEFRVRTNNLGLSVKLLSRPLENTGSQTYSGWYTWFWEEGLNFIYWQSHESGGILGIEVERIALIADIVAGLPDSDISEPAGPIGRIVLSDVRENTIYQWGAYKPAEGEYPISSISLSPPISTWKLGYFADETENAASPIWGGYFSLISGIVVLLIALSGLAIYFYRENSREIREAFQKVSFVNQVSHELKTPLTNIRMYAELLTEEIAADAEKAQGYLNVVVSESRRLSRLILNVLTFAGKEKKSLKLNIKPGIIENVISGVIENFRPALESKGVEIDFIPDAETELLFDADILEQILNNLVSNVEKYSASGKYLRIESSRDGDKAVILVSDRGPGIPQRDREKIFLPFTRLSNRLTNGISGAGIGLTIARNLAVLHGGKLEVLPSERGAVFRLIIRVEESNRGI